MDLAHCCCWWYCSWCWTTEVLESAEPPVPSNVLRERADEEAGNVDAAVKCTCGSGDFFLCRCFRFALRRCLLLVLLVLLVRREVWEGGEAWVDDDDTNESMMSKAFVLECPLCKELSVEHNCMRLSMVGGGGRGWVMESGVAPLRGVGELKHVR